MSVCPCVQTWSRRYPLNRSTFYNQPVCGVIYHREPECHADRLEYYLRGQAHSEGICSQDTIVSTILSELIILLHLGLMVHHHPPKFPVKDWAVLLKAKNSEGPHF